MKKTVYIFPFLPIPAPRMNASSKDVIKWEKKATQVLNKYGWLEKAGQKLSTKEEKDKRRAKDLLNRAKRYRRYYAYKKEILAHGTTLRFKYPSRIDRIIFYRPVPTSWSEKRKKEHYGQPYKVRPDRDNLEKAFQDALCPEDNHVWHGSTRKLYCPEGEERIEVYVLGEEQQRQIDKIFQIDEHTTIIQTDFDLKANSS